MTFDEIWNKLNKEGYLDEDSSKFKVGNAVLNFVRDLDGLDPDYQREAVNLALDIYNPQEYIPTTFPDEWVKIGETLWKNVNDSNIRSVDGGRTYYSLKDPNRAVQFSIVL